MGELLRINSRGLRVRGRALSYTTEAPVPPGYVRFGTNLYRTVVVGDQEWMAVNLNEKLLRCPGEPAAETTYVEDMTYLKAHDDACCYYNFDRSYAHAGLLYKWASVCRLDSGTLLDKVAEPSEGLAYILHDGWRLPSLSDFSKLCAYCGVSTNTNAKYLKATTGWDSGAGTDDFGLAFEACGRFNSDAAGVGSFSGFGTLCMSWLSSYRTTGRAGLANDIVLRTNTQFAVDYANFKLCAFSVRLMRDI